MTLVKPACMSEHWSPTQGELAYLNVGTGIDLSIRELANQWHSPLVLVERSIGIQLNLTAPKKQLDVSVLQAWVGSEYPGGGANEHSCLVPTAAQPRPGAALDQPFFVLIS